jgi:glutamate-1-semialdehyde 2,1-aminomutase
MSNQKNRGQKLYLRAKKIIPGGTMLLSKRPEMFLPDLWPSYFSKAKGCEVWDLDGKKYIDMSIMGIGTNTLGYGNKEVDEAVINNIGKGNMSTFNCPEEVFFAEKLVDVNPWADMVRFARSGGEANAIAIRIARAASGKDNIAICGYHGWHDWYLSANHNKKDELGEHLLKGLNPAGVPKKLKDTVYPFHYNDFKELETIVKNQDVGVIKLEVMRNFEPEDNFLQKVRELATKNNIVLIFDECTSGFRETFGGIFKKFDVEPDMAMFGKTMGNGYAITAVVGRRDVMEAAQKTFISSTFWTERIGPTAGLKTLEVMERIKSWEIITDAGNSIREEWLKLSTKYELPIEINGILPISTFSFNSQSNNEYKTYITQEMLKKGFLANTSFYACIDHSNKIIKKYSESLESIFYEISDCEKGNKSIHELLETSPAHQGLFRLN